MRQHPGRDLMIVKRQLSLGDPLRRVDYAVGMSQRDPGHIAVASSMLFVQARVLRRPHFPSVFRMPLLPTVRNLVSVSRNLAHHFRCHLVLPQSLERWMAHHIIARPTEKRNFANQRRLDEMNHAASRDALKRFGEGRLFLFEGAQFLPKLAERLLGISRADAARKTQLPVLVMIPEKQRELR